MLGRWVAVDTMSSSLRYRSTANVYGIHMFDFGQHRELLDGHFKFDRNGDYAVYFTAPQDGTLTGPMPIRSAASLPTMYLPRLHRSIPQISLP